MSIARTAPESFELQDLICIELVFRFGLESIESFLVEPKGGEDGALRARAPGPLLYEIQGKAGATMATLADLALWLTHFPERRDREMLLERLIGDPARRLIVVVAGRAADALDPLVAPSTWKGEALKAPPAQLAKDLLSAFRASPIVDKGTKALHNRRVAHHAKAAAAMTEAQLRDALGRIVVIDRAAKAEVTDKIGRYLRERGIPDDVHADVIGRLRGIVGTKRKGVEDVASAIEDQVARDVPHSIRPLDYVVGPEEAGWVESTRSVNCLLLSGVTRSGKSVAARWIASEFERRGARIGAFEAVEEAERFLLNPGSELRVAVLDDPLGGVRPAHEADRQLQRLEVLATKLGPARRLIVAQGQERLLEVAGVGSLDDCRIHGHAWIDTAGRSLNFVADLWHAFADQAGVAEPLRSAMADALRAGTARLEPGTLQFLANLPAAKSGSMSVRAAVRAALIDAKTLSRALAGEASSPTLMRALAIGSSPGEAVAWEEIAFISGDGGELLPTKAGYLGLMMTMGGGPRAAAPLPAYASAPTLDLSSLTDLDMLERRGMIETSAADRSNFTHPFYRAATELLFQAPSRPAAKQMLAMHERALFARSAPTSRAAARNLDWILARAGASNGIPKALFDRAMAGLESLYPATRDLCFDFLQRNIDHPEAADINIVAAGNRVASVELESLDWLGGEAIYPVDGRIRDDAVFRGWDVAKAGVIAPALAALAHAGGSALTPEAAADTLLYLKVRPTAATVEHVASLLSYDEAVLRAEAVKMWLMRKRSADEAVLERIFADAHPLVARRALGGAIAGFSRCGPRRQARLIEGLLSMATAPANAVLFLQRLVLFDRDHLMPAERPWAIFEALMPVVLGALPVSARFIEARLHNVMLDAGTVLSQEKMAQICDRWLSWVERMNAVGYWLDDFALGVMDILFRYLADRPDLRGAIVERLLRLTVTTSRLTVIRDALAWWPSLSPDERQALRTCLTEEASDARWRQAVALTREDVPPEIEADLLPEGVRLTDGHVRLRAEMPSILFDACFGVAAGHPDLLNEWRPRPTPEVWNEAIEAIARDPRDPLFPAAFGLVATRADREDAAFIETLTAAAQIDPDAVFEPLLERTIYDGAIARAEHWQALLGLDAVASHREGWLSRMAEVAHEVLSNVTTLDSWILDPALRATVAAKLTSDYKVYEALVTLHQLKEMVDDLLTPIPGGADDDDDDEDDPQSDFDPRESVRLLAVVIVRQIEETQIQFVNTIDDTSNLLERMEILTDALKARLTARRETLLAAYSNARTSYSEARREALPEGWITGS